MEDIPNFEDVFQIDNINIELDFLKTLLEYLEARLLYSSESTVSWQINKKIKIQINNFKHERFLFRCNVETTSVNERVVRIVVNNLSAWYPIRNWLNNCIFKKFANENFSINRVGDDISINGLSLGLVKGKDNLKKVLI